VEEDEREGICITTHMKHKPWFAMYDHRRPGRLTLWKPDPRRWLG
jgi:hypothetical protein